MKNLIGIAALAIALGLNYSNPANAEDYNLNKCYLTNEGYSHYFANLTDLQKHRQQQDIVIATPNPVKTWFKSVFFNGDIATPSQPFGFYDIKEYNWIQ